MGFGIECNLSIGNGTLFFLSVAEGTQVLDADFLLVHLLLLLALQGVVYIFVDFEWFFRPFIDASVKFADLLILLGRRVQNGQLAGREAGPGALVLADHAS